MLLPFRIMITVIIALLGASTAVNGAMELTSVVRSPQPQAVQQLAIETEMQDVTNHGYSTNLEMIELSYWNLTEMICDKLTSLEVSREVSVNDLRKFVADRHCQNQKVKRSIKRSVKISRLFSVICENKLWTYQHYSLLHCIIKTFGTRDAKSEMKEWMDGYIVEYNGYAAAEKIIEAIPKYYHRAKRNQLNYPSRDLSFDEKDLEILGTRLSTRVLISNESIQYIDSLWSEIAARFRIPSLTAYLYSILEGSVIVTWLIPPGWACCILGDVQRAGGFFKRLQMLLVEVDSICIYDEENGISNNEVSNCHIIVWHAIQL